MSAQVADRPATVDALMAQAYALEREAQQRYLEFADIMENHNSSEVAAMFRSIAAQEAAHADAIRRRMGGALADIAGGPLRDVPALERAHYLMQPWHVLQIAIEAERRAHDFFAAIAQGTDDGELREAAEQLRQEESEHLALLDGWLARVPVPGADWDEDPDPPRYTD